MNLIKLTLIIAALSLASCSNYIAQMHREFDQQDGYNPPPQKRDQFAMYRGQQSMQPRRQSPRSLSSKPMINSESNPYVVPAVKRDYRNPSEDKKRYKADDLADNQGDGSLWSGVEGRNNYLFTEEDQKSHGDIILIKVAGKLKNEITAELKRAFPSPIKAKEGAQKEGDPGKAPASAAAAPSKEDDKVDDSTDKIYDRISSVVVEEINDDHLLLRGRKNVLYKNRKRVVEVQALVTRRDVLTDDTVNSNRIIENQVTVIR